MASSPRSPIKAAVVSGAGNHSSAEKADSDSPKEEGAEPTCAEDSALGATGAGTEAAGTLPQTPPKPAGGVRGDGSGDDEGPQQIISAVSATPANPFDIADDKVSDAGSSSSSSDSNGSRLDEDESVPSRLDAGEGNDDAIEVLTTT